MVFSGFILKKRYSEVFGLPGTVAQHTFRHNKMPGTFPTLQIWDHLILNPRYALKNPGKKKKSRLLLIYEVQAEAGSVLNKF
jgi:hypothetical protein